MNRQVFSLLVLNSFVTPLQLSGAAGGGATNMGTLAGSVASTSTSELLSSQLSSMLSKISKDFDVGVTYRPGDAITSKEMEVALSTQLFNDKLSIDGNVGVNNRNQTITNTNNPNNIVGDVNVDYKLTDDGKVRVKAFNRPNDITQIYSSSLYTQGLGVFYREEFDTIGELYKRYLSILKIRKNKEKKTETPN
jgi:hypothetical protein